jgi:hypothetical protein
MVTLLLLLALAVRVIGMLMRGFRLLQGVRSLLLALGMVVAAVLLGCGPVGLGSGLVLFGSLGVRVLRHFGSF